MLQKYLPGIFRSGSPEGMVIHSDELMLVQETGKKKRFARAHLNNSASRGTWVLFTSIPDGRDVGRLKSKSEYGARGFRLTGGDYPREAPTALKVYRPNIVEKWMYSLGRSLLKWE